MRIVPANGLLFWTALILVPMMGWGFSGAPTAGLAWLVIIVFLLVVVIDIALASKRASLTAEFADEMRLVRGVTDEIELYIEQEKPAELGLRLGLLLDPACTAYPLVQRVRLPAAPRTTLRWDVSSEERGEFAARGVVCELRSPLRLWDIRTTLPAEGSIRVYPNLRQDRKQVAATFMRRNGYGQNMQRQIGQGREFEQLREYLPGDSYDEIHWKGTAKRGFPITKIFLKGSYILYNV